MTLKLRKIKIKRKSMRKQKRNYLKKYQKGGGGVATYEPHIKTGETAYANSVSQGFARTIFMTMSNIQYYSMIHSHFYNSGIAKYLAGCGKFIGPNKLLPLNAGEIIASRPSVFYYMSQLVHDSCIITMPGFKRQIADAHGQVWARLTQQFTGYNRKPPIITMETVDRETVYVVNTDDPYGDKFLVIPNEQAAISQPEKVRTIHTFTPTEKSNIYNVPGIGDVIMNDPGNGEPWYGEKVTVIFDYNFKPPKIDKNSRIRAAEAEAEAKSNAEDKALAVAKAKANDEDKALAVAKPEYDDDAVAVVKFTFSGKTYLKDAGGTVYDVNTEEEVGTWDGAKIVFIKYMTVSKPVEDEDDELSEDEEKVEVVKFKYRDGKEYLGGSDGVVYDVDTQEPIGTWDVATKTIIEN